MASMLARSRSTCIYRRISKFAESAHDQAHHEAVFTRAASGERRALASRYVMGVDI